MKKILLILALGSTLFGLQNCRKDFYDNITDDALLGEWDSTFYYELAQAPTDTTTKISTVKLDNGTSVLDFLKTYDPNFLTQQNITPRRRLVQTPEEQRNLLIARMIAKGLDLCDKIKWKGLYPAQPNGLAYVWGGKDHTTPTLPLSPHRCPDKLHGVDCSGLVFQAAKSAGLTFNKGNCDCIYLRDTSNWNNIFRKHPEYKNLIAVPYKQGPTFNEDSLRPGDIIFKSCFGTKCTKPYVHVGIYAAGPYQQDWCIVIQSDGDKNGNCEKAKNTGPRVIQWNKDSAFGRSTTKYGKDWEVVRIETNKICRQCDYSDTVEDVDGNKYPIVKIGKQYWMASNLRTTKYNDGTPIPEVTDSRNWARYRDSLTDSYDSTPKWCYPQNNSKYNLIHGKLYTYYTIDKGKICPSGWHVPTISEWLTLADSLGGATVAGGKMKSCKVWESPNTDATNSSCFNALPSGVRQHGDYNNLFVSDPISYGATWWSSTPGVCNGWGAEGRPCALAVWILYNEGVFRVFDSNESARDRGTGRSIRCVKD